MKHPLLSHLALFAAAILASLPCRAAEEPASEPTWGAWQDELIYVGNERDGFSDTLAVRRLLSTPGDCDGVVTLPYLAQAPDEERQLLLLSCGSPKRRGVILESTDNGESWHSRNNPGDAQAGIGGWGLSCVGNGVILMTDAFYRSPDGGVTWQDLGGFPVNPRFGVPISGWMPVVAEPGSDGQHLYRTRYANRNFGFMEHKCVPLIDESHDAGLTWSVPRAIAEFVGSNEVALAYNAKQEMVAAIRATTLMSPPNDEHDRLETAVSTDGGVTWSKPIVVAGNGRHHPSMALLPDGRMVLSYVVRMGYPDTPDGLYAYGIEAVLSSDGGRTWDTAHRYLLARWTSDCMMTDENGRRYQGERYFAAPMNTSTIYLPQDGSLLTAYGIAQNPKLQPLQVGIVRWRPLDSYSGITQEPPAPIPAAESLRSLRSNRFWPVNYQAVVGMPDCGWRGSYPGKLIASDGTWLHLDHRGNSGYYSLRGIDCLETINCPVALRMRINILPTPPLAPQKSGRLVVNCVVGSGQDKYAITLSFTSEGDVQSALLGGKIDLPTTVGTPFLLEIYVEPRSHCARLWIDGKLVKEHIAPIAYLPAEQPAVFYFGSGSGGVDGCVDIAGIQFGPITP